MQVNRFGILVSLGSLLLLVILFSSKITLTSASSAGLSNVTGASVFVVTTPTATPTPQPGPIWADRDDDGDGIQNGVDNCPFEANADQNPAACQMQAITVPFKPDNLSIPHPTYSGATITLKGIARYGGTQFRWDFGDGSQPTPWTTFNNGLTDLGLKHAYTGSVGQTFTATLYVGSGPLGSPTTTATAAYPIQIMQSSDLTDPAQMDVRAAMAVDKALWYLHLNLTRGQAPDGTPGYFQPYAYANQSPLEPLPATCAALDAFQRHGSLAGNDRRADPYVEDSQSVLNYVLAGAQPQQISARYLGNNPDVNGNGIGIHIDAQSNEPMYTAGICAMAVADSGNRNASAMTGPANVYGRTYGAISQDLVDWLAYAQNDPNSGVSEGSWGYFSYFQPGTNETVRWVVLGLSALESKMGASLPGFVRPEFFKWLAHTENTSQTALNGGTGFFDSTNTNYLNVANTAGTIIGLDFEAFPVSYSSIQSAEGFIYRHWNDNQPNDSWLINLGDSDAMYSIARAMRDFQPTHITRITDYDYNIGQQTSNSFDWFYTPAGQSQQGYATNLVQRQASDGSWTDNTLGYTDQGHPLGTMGQTAFDAVILMPPEETPVADAGGPYNCTANQTITLDGSGSHAFYPGDPITFGWDLDHNGTFDDSNAANPSYTCGNVNGAYLVCLKVTATSGLFNNDCKTVIVSAPSPTPTPTPTPTPIPTLGSYPLTSIALSSDAVVTPDVAPTGTASLNVSTSTDFKGTLEADPATGVVRVTNAHPAGTYTVMVRAFDAASTTTTFTLTVTTPATCSPANFGIPVNFTAGSTPRSLAVGDFNRDGKQDLAVVGFNSIGGFFGSILLGDGAGNFVAGTSLNFSIGSHPVSIAVGDFNNDAKEDLAVADELAVSIFLGDGTGNFGAATNVSVGTNPESLAVGDFNGDGRQDLAVANFSSNNVSVLLGDGTGNFAATTNFGVGSNPASVVVGDFNGDGRQDLVVANLNSNNVSVLLGSGTGSFIAATNFGAGSFPQSLAIGDFNGDGKQDLAVAGIGSSNVSILLGDGNGNFSAANNFGNHDYRSVQVGDFNGDGNQDLAVSVLSSNVVSIFLGDGSGNFIVAPEFGAGTSPISVAVGDFNDDGKQDLAVANSGGSNYVSILLRNCDLPPGADAGGPYTCTANQIITLDGSGSHPTNLGDSISFSWDLADNGLFNDSTVIKPTFTCGNVGNGTIYHVCLRVTSTLGGRDTDCTTVTVGAPINHAPVAQCHNVTVAANANCSANASINNGSSDPDAGDTITVTQSPAGPYSLGTTNVTLTVTDNHGLSSSSSATVTVTDAAAPVPNASSLPDVTGECSADLPSAPSATDACDGQIIGVPDKVGPFGQGDDVITWSFTDLAGNQSSQTQAVHVHDTLPPVPDLATLPTLTAECSVSIISPPTAADNCAGKVTATTSDPLTYTTQGTFTITWTYDDHHGNCSTQKQTVIVRDTTPPVISCPSDIIVDSCHANVSFGTPAASDNCGAVSVTQTAGPVSGSTFPIGPTTVSFKATDAVGQTSSCSFHVTVNPTPTISSVTVTPSTQQYSDVVTLQANLAPASCPLKGMAASNVTFYIGTQNVGMSSLVSDGAGGSIGTLTIPLREPTPFGTAPTGQMAPGMHTVTAVFGGVNPNFTVTNRSTTLNTAQENARAYFTGVCFASTSSATSSSATVLLSATVKDISAVDGADASPGDIRNAKVTFINRDTNTVIASNIPVGLVSSGDTKVGTATYNWNANIGTNDSQSFTIGIIVTNYYTRNSSDDDTIVTVSKPLPANFISGGGYLVLSSPSGFYPGDVGSKNNFGFNVKYNKSNTNLQGNINAIVRYNGRVFQIKGNSMTSLSVATNKATFNGKASIQDITDPLNPVAIDGNATLQVKITDMGEPGTSDTISITVWNKNGGLWFASNWDGTRTIEQLLAAGNVVVR